MTFRFSLVLLLPSLALGPLRAQPVFRDSHAPQISFACDEIARALGPKQVTQDYSIRDLKSDTSSLRLAIAGDVAESNALARMLGVASLKKTTAQSYAIRRKEQGGRLTIAVLGADPTGAMYGALDLV